MRQYLIAGNWKMHGSRIMLESLLGDLKAVVKSNEKVEMAVFPPAIFLERTEALLLNSGIHWGAQNVASEAQGAYTGEISAAMLAEYGCRYVLVGHSERRTLYGETNEIVAKKFIMAQQAGLVPILCVGETLAQRQAGQTQEVVGQQLASVLQALPNVEQLQKAVIAYEPVWAIGTGLTATPEEAQEVHAALRRQVAAKHTPIAEQLRILYGGSLKPANANELLAMPDIDGGLVGGASLNAQEFLQIYHAVR